MPTESFLDATEKELLTVANACLKKAGSALMEPDSNFDQDTKLRLLLEAQSCLAEVIRKRAEQAAERDRKRNEELAQRDFKMEVGVMVLIGFEIVLSVVGLWMGYQQGKVLDKQTSALTHMDTSTAATASAMTSLQRATESMNTTLQMQLDALKKSAAETARNAKAGEASASTASQALHVSERAYVHMTASLLKPPAAGDRVHPIVAIANVGHTPALDVATLSFFSIVPASTPIKTARDIASALPQTGPTHSLFTLPAGQTSTMQTDSQSPYLQSMVDQLTNGEAVLYLFATASYKDAFNQSHHTEICGFYQPKLNNFGACAEYNKSD
jgi:hypothetical protein